MDYKNELTKVMTCFNYRGKLCWKIIGGFMWDNKKFPSLESIDDYEEKICTSISKSITVENKGTINCQNVSINCQNENL